MHISPPPGPRSRPRRRFALAAALAAVVYAGAVPATAAPLSPRAAEGRARTTAVQPQRAFADTSGGMGVRISTTVVPASRRPVSARTWVFAGVGSAVGLAVFLGGGFLKAALARGGRDRARHVGRAGISRPPKSLKR